MVHKGRRWRLNIKVKERPFAEGSSDCKFYKPPKIRYLLAMSSHCPHHRHLEWLRLIRVQLRSICLTNHKLKISCPVKYECPNLMLLDLGPKQVLVIVSIHVSSRTPMGYLLPDDMEQAHIKMTRQIDNEHLDISFIYHWYNFLL
jgi:hypothetical protein